MSGINEKNQFAEDSLTGKIYHIRELSKEKRGKACGCKCPSCGVPMMAKMGKKRIWHFAHNGNKPIECTQKEYAQSVLHKLAKEIIFSNDHMIFPQYDLDAAKDSNRNLCDKKQTQPYHCFDSFDLKYDKPPLLEYWLGDIRPDILLKVDDEEFMVEIAVTHKVEDDKKVKIVAKNISTIEIDLSEFYNKFYNDVETFDKERLIGAIINGVDKKCWIYYKNENKYIEKLIERNRKLEEEYQAAKAQREAVVQIIREQQERASENENKLREQQEREGRINIEKQLIEYSNYSVAENESENVFKRMAFYDLAMEKYNGIPDFCNKKIKDEDVFRCNRQVWQMYLFDKFFYSAKIKTIKPSDIYNYFVRVNYKLLNNKAFATINTKKRDHKLMDAIFDYLCYMHELGFIISEIVGCGADFYRSFSIRTHDIIPPTTHFKGGY